ncbi:hypothetical protein Airi02_060050 [Actinoallomurus iriomotensis]|uniref:Uncharacterized protein n=2 Tax=Actinoallomurus iriomotensis TaxID=478107 RepID=A0A9W6S3T9_9ACTN|nr:hypothetical protein Airi02_060050 [Actinoallomurus iriomotensis]
MSVLAIGHLWAPDPPRDPEALVLRVVFVKGMGSPVERPVPDISVYGDGRMVITLPDRRMVTDQRLTYPAYRRVYRDARLAGLAASRTLHGKERMPDAGPTVVTLLAGGRPEVTTVQPGAGGVRAWLINRLIGRLRSLPPGDLRSPPATYRAARMAIIAWRPQETALDPAARVVSWTLRPPPASRQATCTLLTGTDAEAAARLAASAPPGSYWRSGSHLYAVIFRPLLPDEPDCAAATP